jgi:chromosome segregation ATPase
MDGDESKKLPRGRQTIRKGGSLLGFHGPVSRRIKLWTIDSKPNTTVAQLERAYFAALESVDRFENRSRRNSASSKFTPEGMKADALQFAQNDLLPGLNRTLQTISKAKTELAECKAKINHQEGDIRHYFSDIDELKEAIAAADSAVQAAHEELRVETGALNERDLNDLAASTEQRHPVPWLRRRRDADGTEQIRVVDLERRVERLATPDEIERGVFFENYDEYKAKPA